MKHFLKSLILILCFISLSGRIVSQDLDTAKFNFKVEPFYFVEKMPAFPGGYESMISFIESHLIYPESAKKDKIEGTVVVQFVVDSNGYIVRPKINKSLTNDCDKEALRIIKIFPRWEPGVHNNKPVNISFTLPVRFKL